MKRIISILILGIFLLGGISSVYSDTRGSDPNHRVTNRDRTVGERKTEKAKDVHKTTEDGKKIDVSR